MSSLASWACQASWSAGGPLISASTTHSKSCRIILWASFQTKEAQLDLSNFSGETKSAIAQVGFQMLGKIHVRADEPEF